MKPEIKTLWLEALRSGEYKQIGGKLRKSSGYCCLGVLCELAVVAGVISQSKIRIDENATNFYEYGPDGRDASLPNLVQRWAGLADSPGILFKGVPGKGDTDSPVFDIEDMTSLMAMNDSGFTFLEIADVIEEQL